MNSPCTQSAKIPIERTSNPRGYNIRTPRGHFIACMTPCTCGKGLSVGNTFHLSFFSIFTFSNQFLSIYHIHFIGHIFIYKSLVINKFLASLPRADESLVVVSKSW